MKHLTLGLVGVGRIGLMHAGHLAALHETLHPRGIDVRLVLTHVAAEHARAVAEQLGAGFVADSLPVLAHVHERGGTVQIGHQRRFDAGCLRAEEALEARELGRIHSLRAVTCDMTPPPVEFPAASGGLFGDCSVHDVDVLRRLTGREIVEVCARGSNNGDPAIGAVGDMDSALVVLTVDDGTVGTVSARRYNGAGHDVRLEIQGSEGSPSVGLDQKTAVRSAEPGTAFPSGEPHRTFAERFAPACRAELVAFVELVLGLRPHPCAPQDAVAAS